MHSLGALSAIYLFDHQLLHVIADVGPIGWTKRGLNAKKKHARDLQSKVRRNNLSWRAGDPLAGESLKGGILVPVVQIKSGHGDGYEAKADQENYSERKSVEECIWPKARIASSIRAADEYQGLLPPFVAHFVFCLHNQHEQERWATKGEEKRNELP